MKRDSAIFAATLSSRRTGLMVVCMVFAFLSGILARAQTTVSESFTGSSANGWSFGGGAGSTIPYLTAGVVPGDTVGNGWLRLTENTNNQATYALWDNSIFSINAQIQIEMEYTFWNGHDIGGAQNGRAGDGMTFFLVDASKTSGTFQPGAYGGSLGYAQLDADQNGTADSSGMPGGYLGFGFDNWGNYAGNTEGRVGGVGTTLANGYNAGYMNRLAVRGPDDGDGNVTTGWDFIKASAALDTLVGGGQMDFPTATTRPDQSGADYRSFRLTLDANNQLTVEMKFGLNSSYITVFTADLASYDRPDYFKLGFTAGTGGANEIHEIRNISVTMTPWQPDAFEWDNSAGGTKTWSTASNWAGDVVPSTNADILFGNLPTTGMNQIVTLNDANKKVNSITFDSGFNYTINTTGAGSLVLGDTAVAGLPSINVNDYNGAQAQHHINVPITMAEELKINNYSFSTLCLNGAVTTGGNDIKVNGSGAVNFNADIIGSGSLIKNGSGIVTLNSDNSDATAWTGNVTINQGMVVVTEDGALGGSISGTNNLARSSGNTTLRMTDAAATAAGVQVGQIVTGTNIPAGTYVTGISSSGGNTTITLSQGLSGAVSSGASITFAGTTTVASGGALAFRAADGDVAYTKAETVFIAGRGVARGSEGETGAIYNDGGNNSFAGNIVMTANASVGARDGTLTLSGVISGGYSLTKLGAGVVSLTGTNTYTGATIIEGGVLRVTASSLPGGFATAAPSGGNLTLKGGVLEITGTDFTRALGTGADQVQWTGDGGFSAYGANRTVTLSGGAVTWGSGSFVPTGNALLLSSDYANRTITFTNNIALGAASREVRVANGSAEVDGVLSGVLSGTGGGLNKTGEGTLSLTGTNTYTGNTVVGGGALRVTTSSLPGGYDTTDTASNYGAISLAGGVLELASNTTFTRRLGTGEEQIFWSGSGGFAAAGANRTVTLTNSAGTAGGTLTWNSGSFVPTGGELILGSVSASNTLTLTNAIDLAGANRTVRVQNGAGAVDGLLSGVVSNGSLTVVGEGRLDMTAANTLAGTLTVKGAELRLQGAGTATSVTGITVRDGGTLTLDNGATNSANRILNTATVALKGGTFSLLGRTGNNDTTETVGAVTLDGGANTINVSYGDNTGSAQLTMGSLARTAGAGATVNFTNTGGTLGATGDNPRAIFTTAPTLVSTVMGYATVNGTAFAGHGANGVVAVAGTNTAQNLWTTAINATPTSDQTLTAARTVGSLSLGSGIDVAGGGFTLTVDAGGILSTGATTSIISNGTLRAGTGVTDLVAHVYNTSTAGLQISAVIADNSGAKNFVKTGDGVLTLNGSAANTYTGTTFVNAGTLALNKTAGVNAIAGNVVVGDGRGADKLRLDADEQIANTANMTLRGSGYGTNETVLQFNGAAGVGVSETLGTLTIDGVAVIDFAGGNVCDANFLFLDDLVMASPDSMLYIRNWVDFTDFLLVKNSANLASVFSQIKFEGYGDQAYWESYDSTYSRITPVPEPSTYGAMFIAGAAGLYIWRRRRQQKRAQS